MNKARTRIAPSPTGGLHIGHIRTILFDYALARNTGGEFLVRVEDTDQKRYVDGAVDKLLAVIGEYGLDWDEGPRKGGPYEPYIQSERLSIYKEYALQLIEKGFAYYCFMDEAETKALQEKSKLEKRKLRSPYRYLDPKAIVDLLKSGRPYVIRLKVPEDELITFKDEVLGELKYQSKEIDDQVLIKSDGYPTYHLAVVIDDYLMKITHVLRGNDWLSSTPKHILLYKYFGWELPKFIHLPNLKEKDSGKKLSKRHGAVFAYQFLEQGYLPEALLNFLMFLGWSSPEERVHGKKEREIYSLEEFVGLFSIDRIHKTALVSFDREKLIWFNKEYLKLKSDEETLKLFIDWIRRYKDRESIVGDYLNDTNLQNKLSLARDRFATFEDLFNQLKFFYTRPETIDWDIEQVANFRDKVSQIKSDILELLSALDNDCAKWIQTDWVEKMRAIATKYNLKNGDPFMVLRLCIVGSPYSLPLFEIMQLMSKDEILTRIKNG